MEDEERVQNRMMELIAGAVTPVPQNTADVVDGVEVGQIAQQELVQKNTAEQNMDVLILLFREENVEVLQIPPEVVKVIPTELSSERIVEQRVDLPVPQAAQCAPQRRKKKNRKKPEVLMPVSAMDLDDFVASLVDSDVHISSDVMWDAIDMVVPSGGGCISPQQQVQVAHIPDRHVACRCDWESDRCARWQFDCSSHCFVHSWTGHLNPCHKRERERERKDREERERGKRGEREEREREERESEEREEQEGGCS